MSNNSSGIQSIHFNCLIPIGSEAIPEQRVHQGQLHSGEFILDLSFDDDPRFLLITATHRGTKSTYEQLVSMGSVASLLMKEKRVVVSSKSPGPEDR